MVRRFALLGVLATVAFPAMAVEGVSAWIAGIGMMMSSFKVTSMQSSATTERVSANKLQSGQAAASAQIDLYNRDQVRRMWNDYGPTGQLVDGCFQVAIVDAAAQIKNRTDASAGSAAALVYSMSDDGRVSSPGVAGVFGATVQRSNVPFAASTAKRAVRHQQKYCSVAEARAGYCALSPNGMQSGDADFSLHYAPGQTYGWDQAEAAADFVKTVAPVKPLPAAGCSEPVCQVALRARRDEEVYLSMSRYSLLRFVESRSTQASGPSKQPATQ